jgi:hypothetical protein
MSVGSPVVVVLLGSSKEGVGYLYWVTFSSIIILSGLSFIGHLLGYTRGGRLDELWYPHFKGQVKKKSQLMRIASENAAVAFVNNTK